MSHVLSNRSKNRLEFSIHSAVLPAFSFFHSRQFWVDKAVMQQSSLDKVNVSLTLQAGVFQVTKSPLSPDLNHSVSH